MEKSGEIVDGRGTYQVNKLRAAVAQCKQKRTAIDIGGHVGLWSMQLAKIFNRVEAFEPVAAHRDCYIKNVLDGATKRVNVTLHPFALGKEEGRVAIHTTKFSSGDSWVKGDGDIPMKTLDSFNFEHVDFIKVDTEGYEENILRGGTELLVRCRPVVIVEQKRDMATARFGLPPRGAVTFLENLGYKLVEEMSGDYVMVPR
jgi:FkbM family methyltransferase